MPLKQHVGTRLRAQDRNGGIELLLVENVEHLGQQGEIVRVKPGFARNYLLPMGLATVATEENKRAVEEHRGRQAEVLEKRKAALQSLAAKVSEYSVTIEANANEEGVLYGSVLEKDISKSLKAAGFAVDADHVKLEGAIKSLGMYTVRLQFHPEVSAEVKIWVVPAATR
jgi:large subunit ribosomal protein L9